MNVNAVQLCKPIRISDEHDFGITPFGMYCFRCKSSVGGMDTDQQITLKNIRNHQNRNPHVFLESESMKAISSQIANEMTKRFGDVRNYNCWISNNNMTSYSCYECGKSYETLNGFIKHKKKYEKENPGSVHNYYIVKSVKTVCNRVITQQVLELKMNEPVEIYRTIPNSEIVIVSNRQEQINEEKSPCPYIPIQNKNRKWLTVKMDQVKRLFSEYKRVNENLEPYLPSLKLMVVNDDGVATDTIKSSLLSIKGLDEENNDSDLLFFLKCMEIWLKNYCREHVNVLDGNVRFHLQSYFDESILVNSGYNLNFNMRENEDTILNELLLIVELSWKLHDANKCDESISEVISGFKNDIRKIKRNNGGVFTENAVEQMIETLLIQRYLHSILIEKRENAYSLLIGHRIITTRLFKIKKGSDDNDNVNSISMRTCGEYGSTIASHLHIYRLASASLIACTDSSCWGVILKEVKESPLFHTISPTINKVKQMHNAKIDIRKKQLKENGDIIIDDFYFPKCKWSRMVPKLRLSMNEILKEIFINNEWQLIIDTKNELTVNRIENESTNEKCDLLHYNFFINVDGKFISEKDLKFKTDILPDVVEKITGLVMICLHGLGLGSTRVTELYQLEQHQLSWKCDSLYYLTTSNKRRSSTMDSKKRVEHKLPYCISRYLLLYDYIGREFASGRDYFLFKKGTIEIESDHKNVFFYEEFQRLFDLPTKCNCLQMRHLYTSICNYLFPSSGDKVDSVIISTSSQIAEMSGHSVETHDAHYSSSISIESRFDKYHHHVGADIIIKNNRTVQIKMATEDEVRFYLKLVIGPTADFLSNLQKKMLIDTCNNTTKHALFCIGCGGGKSMSWILPVVRNTSNNFKAKMSIVIIPYCFLLDHHVDSTRRVLGNCALANISIVSLKGKDITDVLPNELRHKDSLPSLLFVSLEAIRKLIHHHLQYFRELQNEDYLFKIYIDECHTVLSELNFRPNYLCLSTLARINVPIAMFSGTFPKFFIKKFLFYMFGVDDLDAYNISIDDNIFGKDPMKMKHIQTNDYTGECCTKVVQFVANQRSSNVHVIVSTKDEGDIIYQTLMKSRIQCAYIHSGSSNQNTVASMWNKNQLRVLITTTLGLVGNESRRTQMVCIVGMHYNLPSIIQAYGRIRLMRRTKASQCLIFTSNNNKERLKNMKKESEYAFNQLVSGGIIAEKEKNNYRNSMTMQSVNDWLINEQGCRLVSLAGKLGFRRNVCRICDNCTDTSVNRAAIQTEIGIREADKNRKNGLQLLRLLKQKCLCCGQLSCSGNCVVATMGANHKCFHCLGNHFARNCPGHYRKILKGKACFSCYVYNYSEDALHTHSVCSAKGEIQERLRGLIQS